MCGLSALDGAGYVVWKYMLQCESRGFSGSKVGVIDDRDDGEMSAERR